MKKLSIFVGTFIILFSTSCNNGATPFKTAFVSSNNGGGNPEVHLNLCISLKDEAKTACLEKFFPNNPKLFIVPSNEQRILLAGRGKTIEQRTIHLQHDEILLIALNTKNIKKSLHCNIDSAKLIQEHNKLVIQIRAKDIDKKVILKDSNEKVILIYEVIKDD